jgi:hypothetical protein
VITLTPLGPRASHSVAFLLARKLPERLRRAVASDRSGGDEVITAAPVCRGKSAEQRRGAVQLFRPGATRTACPRPGFTNTPELGKWRERGKGE